MCQWLSGKCQKRKKKKKKNQGKLELGWGGTKKHHKSKSSCSKMLLKQFCPSKENVDGKWKASRTEHRPGMGLRGGLGSDVKTQPS